MQNEDNENVVDIKGTPEMVEELKSKFINKNFADKIQLMKDKVARGEEIVREDKVKVAVLADSPNVVTGFGNVCREILTNLYATGFYDFEVVGINYDGSPHDMPFKIYPAINALVADNAYREPYGRQRFLDMIGEGRFDLVWVLQDSFIVCAELAQRIKETNDVLPLGQQFAFMYYFPIDAAPKKQWIDGSAMHADIPIVYTRYGYDEIMKLYAVGEDSKLKKEEQEKNIADGEEIKKKLGVIYHGVNAKDFFPIEDKELMAKLRQKFWGVHKDKFVFINVNRNQPRKDLFRTLLAFKILLERRRAKGKDDVYLYLHCNVFDNNINLLDVAKQIGIAEGEEFAFPDPKIFGPASGFPIETLNHMYNASDAVVSTTLGEGWGLSITEGFATKKPVIAPDHTSLTEILGKTDGGTGERGILVKTFGEFVQQNDNGRVRPMTDPYDLADKMEFVLENRQILEKTVETAYEWVMRHQWSGDEICGKWRNIFEEAFKIALTKRALKFDQMLAEQAIKKDAGRNDICPICKTMKLKKCRHGQGRV